ncbi:MAG TPA: ABC transporter permease, partial [Anaerolineae bacterium]|nr:ABC transporter permease [Anaerolineae bacterium]
MTRLLKYLKPFTLLILLAIALLYLQAMADLSLPDYMSKIVNNGIQQGGVESAVPSAIRQSEMDRLALFMSPDDRAQVLAAYTLVNTDSPDYGRDVTIYPALANEPVYVLNDTGRAKTDALNPIMGKTLLVVSGIEQMMADPAKAAAFAQGSGLDISKLPPGSDVFAMLRRMPEAQRAQLTAAVDTKFAALGESMVVQMAAPAVRAEYAALGMDTDSLQSRYIFRTGLTMLALALLAAACAVAVGFLSAKTAAGLARDLRRHVFRRVESFSGAEFDKFSTASLITRSTNDVTQMQMVVIMLVRMVFYAPIIGIGGVIRALGKSTSMWWIIALAVTVLVGLVITVFSVTLPRFRLIQTLIDRLNLVTREQLSGMMVIRAFNRQDLELNRFDKANSDLTGIMLFVNRIMVVMMPVMMLIMNGLMLTIIWVGAHQVAASRMQVGDMMAFMQYA